MLTSTDPKEQYLKAKRLVQRLCTRLVELTPCCPEQTKGIEALNDALWYFKQAIEKQPTCVKECSDGPYEKVTSTTT